MPYTVEQLRDAVITHNESLVDAILAERDANGIPLVDINAFIALDASQNLKYSILMWAIYNRYSDSSRGSNLHIVQALLNVRDNKGNPVININAVDKRSKATTLSCVFGMDKTPIETRRKILALLLDFRNTKNERALDFSKENHFSLLKGVYDKHDLTFMEMLLNARDAQDEPIININAFESWSEETILDNALVEAAWHSPNPDMIALIKRFGGFTSSEIKARKTDQIVNGDICNLYEKSPGMAAVNQALNLDLKEGYKQACYNLISYICHKFDNDLTRLCTENLSEKEDIQIADKIEEYLNHLEILVDSVNSLYAEPTIKKVLECIMHAKNLVQDYGHEFHHYDMNKLNKFHLKLLMRYPEKWQFEINRLSAEIAGYSFSDTALGEVNIDSKTIIKLLGIIANQKIELTRLKTDEAKPGNTLISYKKQKPFDVTSSMSGNEEQDISQQNTIKGRRNSIP